MQALASRVSNLHTLYRGLFVTTPDWRAQVAKADSSLELRLYEHEAIDRSDDERYRAQLGATSNKLLIIVDESENGNNNAISQTPHAVRAALYDMRTKQPIATARVQGTTTPQAEDSSPADPGKVQDCEIGMKIREGFLAH
jgi:hypothetical protein